MQYKVKEESRLDYMFTSCCIWSLLAIGSTARPYPVRRHHSRFLLLCFETHHYLYWHVGTLNLVRRSPTVYPKCKIGSKQCV
jgi:hypothetical protein